jgi:hypothetical protein
VVAGHFHQLRVGGDDAAYTDFMEGYEYVMNLGNVVSLE